MTSEVLDRVSSPRSQWFVSWFDSFHYHKLYAYRNDAEAAEFIDALIGRLQPNRGSVVLDLGCGTGRHSRYLASKGFHVTGLDLSAASIEEARHSELPDLQFCQHDMRAPFGSNTVDYIFNCFTSFGYFEDPAEHLAVIRNIAEALKDHGRLVLDYLNVRYAETRPMDDEVRIIDGFVYRITRWSNAGHFFKRIVIEDAGGNECGEHLEQVAKFTLEDFRLMFSVYGLAIDAVYGDYRLNSYDPVASPRMILVARKEKAGEI